MEPMFIYTPFTWIFWIGSVALVIAAGVVGFLWYRRLTGVESVAHVFRATAPGRSWPIYAVAGGVVLLTAAVLLAQLIAHT